jgi:hypothetical protein
MAQSHKLQKQTGTLPPSSGGKACERRNKMKKLIATLGVVSALVVSGFSVAKAAYTKGDVAAPITAQATVGGISTAAIIGLPVLHDITNFANTPSVINWSSALSGGGYKVADQVIELKWKSTGDVGLAPTFLPASGIQLYTDNTNALANPRFTRPAATVDSSPNAVASGLVNAANPTKRLSLAWRVLPTTFTVLPVLPSDPSSATEFAWFFVGDSSNSIVNIDWNQNGVTTDPGESKFVNGSFYNCPILGTGIQSYQTQSFPDPGGVSYIYLEADFSLAAAGATYRTNRIILEAFTQ